jgi:flagellar biosynthesis protein FlhG
VCVVDADLGAANLHTALGVLHPRRCLADYIDHQTETLDDVMTQVTPTVQLAAGTSRPGSANLGATEKLRLLRAIANLDTEVVIIDVGAGTSYTVVDLFAAADHKLLVLTPQLTSLHNAYALLKACVHRVVRKHATDEMHKDLIDSALGQETKARTIPQLLGTLRPLDETLGSSIENTLTRFGVSIVGNQLSSPAEAEALRKMTPLIRDKLMVNAPFIAGIKRSQSLAGSLLAGVGTIASKPNDEANLAFRQLADVLLATDLSAIRGVDLGDTARGRAPTVPLWIQRGLEADAAAGR